MTNIHRVKPHCATGRRRSLFPWPSVVANLHTTIDKEPVHRVVCPFTPRPGWVDVLTDTIHPMTVNPYNEILNTQIEANTLPSISYSRPTSTPSAFEVFFTIRPNALYKFPTYLLALSRISRLHGLHGSVPFRRNPIRRILEKYTVRVVAVVLWKNIVLRIILQLHL